ncbi:preprotein translocase subunit SecG [Cognatiyoonia sediminum]|uniref:Protein-export membrane protein SecG n=1 Tax=Cognatiyoonia sediminum TaxID=1508389 RepID=A0A1M5L435_9RHOB|nr:preprotein translocase subunit SecG [Cognatiyoonia sediminum]SHG59778.1 preprotein translocase subunit SecG [Cognatiyoonia sediminum]
MENVVLVIHLILASSLIGAVLMQRSEGAGLGLGGGGGGPTGGRAAATALGKFTWLIAIGFICTSIALTIIGAQNASGSSVVDGLDLLPPAAEDGTTPDLGDSLLPPSGGDEPLIPSGN